MPPMTRAAKSRARTSIDSSEPESDESPQSQDSRQQQHETYQDVPRRPILHHLNADSSWLLQLPIPSSSEAQSANGRHFCNVLIDPWLKGPQSDVASWFSRQWHAEESRIASVADASTLARQAEDQEFKQRSGNTNAIDLVVVSHEFTDHCHEETLLEVDSSVAVLAPPKAAGLIREFDHFDRVVDIEPSPSRPAAEAALPSWLNVTRIQKPDDALYYHSAIVITFKGETGEEECVIYTPHGVAAEALSMLKAHSPKLQPLCLIHGLHDVWLTLAQQLNLGGHNGLMIQRTYKSKYWVGTHDEVKPGAGLIGWFLNRKVITFEEALRQESEILKEKGDASLEDVHFEEIPNGGCKILT